MISGLGASPAAYVQPFQSGSARAGTGASPAAPGLQGDTKGTQGSVQGLLNSAEVPARVQGLSSTNKGGGERELSSEDEQKVKDLKGRETEVRAHEAAHSAAGGSLTGGTSFDYATGPDGKNYIVGGEVSIDSSGVSNDPEATIRKMDLVIQAATAPAEPSSQDRQVAAQAQQTRTTAISEAIALAAQEDQQQSGGTGNPGETGARDSENTSGTSADGGLQALLSQAIEAYQAPAQTSAASGEAASGDAAGGVLRLTRASDQNRNDTIQQAGQQAGNTQPARVDPFSEALTRSGPASARQDEDEASEQSGAQNLLSRAIDAYREPHGFTRQADFSV